ncbi:MULTISPECIES: hypothetical protein [Lysobacter]|uniref:DUF4880 domain-containing protein n=1 Tax=Lysobacter yananisis TaxID=1003114 RepID=A0ABY9P5C6_9GAMM|nr:MULTISPECIES: hypothetical protein [Lysobacter]QCW26444.1 hypothetical protein FE772_13005 [Lysobacter enzymogenes]QQQ03701.1 hypothetical protein JHW41_12500 [Lysobacter enzymogenes]UZW58403.1 hypothetical protein BV903_013845 [Lysobacter enzymogenes]WMT02116.1 hypothetical protein RDV84_19435 [Lysobacter yananisis]
MSEWEIQVNLALRELGLAQADGRIAAQEYRRCRRQLLLKALHFGAGADTLRRDEAHAPRPPPPAVDARKGLPRALRSWALWLWCLCMLLGAAALYAYWLGHGAPS